MGNPLLCRRNGRSHGSPESLVWLVWPCSQRPGYPGTQQPGPPSTQVTQATQATQATQQPRPPVASQARRPRRTLPSRPFARCRASLWCGLPRQQADGRTLQGDAVALRVGAAPIGSRGVLRIGRAAPPRGWNVHRTARRDRVIHLQRIANAVAVKVVRALRNRDRRSAGVAEDLLVEPRVRLRAAVESLTAPRYRIRPHLDGQPARAARRRWCRGRRRSGCWRRRGSRCGCRSRRRNGRRCGVGRGTRTGWCSASARGSDQHDRQADEQKGTSSQ